MLGNIIILNSVQRAQCFFLHVLCYPQTENEDQKNIHYVLSVRRCYVQSDTPGALKEAEGGEVIGRFEEIGFGCSFMDDAEAVELHAVPGSVLVSQSEQIRSHSPDSLILKRTQAQSHESISITL